MITIKIADIPIGIDNKYLHIKNLARDYLTDLAPLFTVSATEGELDKEASLSSVEFTRGYLEAVVVYRKIAEQLPRYDAFVFHGAVMSLEGEAYAITARSGVGKTTHTRLWLEAFGDRAHYLNGDKPIIRFIDGVPYACGTPWQGKEDYGRCEMRPLRSIAFLERGKENHAYEIPLRDATIRMASQIYLPKENPTNTLLAMSLLDKILRSVTLVRLECNMDISAAHVAIQAMTKGEFK